MSWQRRAGVIVILGSLMPLAANATSTPTLVPPDTPKTLLQTVALDAPFPLPKVGTSLSKDDTALARQVAEARRTLIALQGFVEEATRIARLGERLKSRRLDNQRLRRSLQNHRTARDVFATNLRPSETLAATLTKTVIDNWLETVRLKHRSKSTHDTLATSERSWLKLKQRVVALKRNLDARRAEIRSLRAERTALSIELGRMKREIDQTTSVTRELRGDRKRLMTAKKALYRDVASGLRMILQTNETP